MGVDKQVLQNLALSEQEYDRIVQLLGKEPSSLALSIFAALWSEHCAYKHSKRLLKKYLDLFALPGAHSYVQMHENAGAVKLDDENWMVMKIESHNHPSAIEPYQGAATGIGGIVRDILTLGARPIALLNSLRFGHLQDPKDRRLYAGVVSGIAGYGNCLGVPNVGGEIAFEAAYSGTPLVNVMCVGHFKQSESALKWTTRYPQEQFILPFTEKPPPKLESRPFDYVLVLFGADTGRDGIQGAAFASAVLNETGEDRRPAVQIGNPFKEKLLIEACLELSKLDCVDGMQDLGAAGLAGAVTEYAERRGVGVEIDVGMVPRRERGMNPEEVMVSESQERMLVVVKPGCERDVNEVLEKWGLSHAVVGRLTRREQHRAYEVVIRDGDRTLERIKQSAITDSPLYAIEGTPSSELTELQNFNLGALPMPEESANDVLLRLLRSPNIANKQCVYQQYDHQVQTNTVVSPGGDAAVLRVKGTQKGIALATDGNGRYCYLDPFVGGQIAVAEACRNVACTGAKPLALTDCLNFGNPKRPEVYYQLEECIKGMAEASKALAAPVISGNVSLYNETQGESIYPTPVIGALGVLEDVNHHTTIAFQRPGDLVVLLGAPVVQGQANALSGSEYLQVVYGLVAGRPSIDLTEEVAVQRACRRLISDSIVASAHDCSDGGLAVTLAESCMARGLGFDGDFRVTGRWDAALFGEQQSRIVVSLPPDHLARMESLCAEEGVEWTWLGTVGGIALKIAGLVDVPVADLDDVWRHAIERALEP